MGRIFQHLALLGWKILGGGVVTHGCGHSWDEGKWSCFPSLSQMASPLVACFPNKKGVLLPSFYEALLNTGG